MNHISQTHSASSVSSDNLGSRLVALPSFHKKLEDISLYCKRDDLFTPFTSFVDLKKSAKFCINALTGNKARKLYGYLSYLHSFPSSVEHSILSLVSYGGLQSNAMVALSELAWLLGVPFYYYAKSPPRSFATVAKNDNSNTSYEGLSNFARATANQMIHIPQELSGDLASRYRYMGREHPRAEVFLEGAASPRCGVGYDLLARGFFMDIKKLSSYTKGENQVNADEVDIVLTAGTGLSGYMLKRALFLEASKQGEKKIPRVFIAPTISKENKKPYTSYVKGYLREQLKVLKINFEAQHCPAEIYPVSRYVFARPHLDLYEMFMALQKHTTITFDLLYDTVGWLALIENATLFKNRTVIYLHQGGVGGNVSLLRRYRYLNLLG